MVTQLKQHKNDKINFDRSNFRSIYWVTPLLALDKSKDFSFKVIFHPPVFLYRSRERVLHRLYLFIGIFFVFTNRKLLKNDVEICLDNILD